MSKRQSVICFPIFCASFSPLGFPAPSSLPCSSPHSTLQYPHPCTSIQYYPISLPLSISPSFPPPLSPLPSLPPSVLTRPHVWVVPLRIIPLSLPPLPCLLLRPLLLQLLFLLLLLGLGSCSSSGSSSGGLFVSGEVSEEVVDFCHCLGGEDWRRGRLWEGWGGRQGREIKIKGGFKVMDEGS